MKSVLAPYVARVARVFRPLAHAVSIAAAGFARKVARFPEVDSAPERDALPVHAPLSEPASAGVKISAGFALVHERPADPFDTVQADLPPAQALLVARAIEQLGVRCRSVG